MPDYTLSKLRGKWAISVWHDGKRLQRLTTGTADRKDAERLLEQFKRDNEAPQVITVSYLWGLYREEKSAKRIAENMAYSGKAVLPFFGHLSPDHITTAKCREYARTRTDAKKKIGTIWTELNHLQIVLNWAKDKRHIQHEVSIERPPKPPPRNRRLTVEEGQALLDAADVPHVKLAIALMLHTGARIGAILDLTWDRVDFAKNLISYPDPADTGNRKNRATVPMNSTLRPVMEQAQRGALSKFVVEYAGKQISTIKRGFARSVELAGLEDVTPHVLRHTAASVMAERGVPMVKIAAVLGHKDSRTTERIYAKLAPGFLADAVAALEAEESGVPTGSSEPVNVNQGGTSSRNRRKGSSHPTKNQ